jgi:rod shape-determining protein MreD
MARRYRSRLDSPPSNLTLILIPVLSVMLGSITTLLPMIATAPILPPFGLLMLISWRLLHRDLWPVWAALPLGLFDDMFSGQPLGSAVMIWTMVFLVIDLFDRRMIWRDYRQDWALGCGLLAAAIGLALAIANATGGATSILYLIPQFAVSALCLPLTARICAALDRVRWQL